MRLVVDTNIIIASLIRDSMARRFLVLRRHELFAPEHAIREVEQHLQLITKKAGISEAEARTVLASAISSVEVVPESLLLAEIDEANSIIGKIDQSDVPFVACALAVHADGIVTYDKDFRRQKAIRVFTPEQLAQQ
ncbi:MAG: PIN domain-containing protein [Candidatus Micrarchaeota archaeon]|nr:PIN domain-containing protein [Candidatus Micrarchaeota archaeon]